MATIEALAIKRALALEKLNQAAVLISDELGVLPPDVSTSGQDPLSVQAQQLHVLAEWAEHVANALASTHADSMPNKELGERIRLGDLPDYVDDEPNKSTRINEAPNDSANALSPIGETENATAPAKATRKRK